ncbi:MAG: VWA domain-containing protein, partial [Candidatus Aminicenantes bacterium]
VLQSFSRDERLIARAVQKASGNIWLDRETDHLVVPSIFEQAAQETAPKSHGGFGIDVESFKASSTDIFQYFAQRRFDKTINGLLAAVNTIKDLPGRKSVLLISGGIPSLSQFRRFGLMTSKGKTVQFGDNVALSDVAAAKIDDPFRILKKPGIRRGEDIFTDFIHFANSYNITFYTLDPDNYLRYVMQDMAYENFPRSATNMSLFDKDEIKEFKKNELNNLKNLAEDTGGASFMGAKKFENFQKVVNRDLSYCYELSFYPKRKKADGKYHKIDVRIKQPGAKVQFRKGYFDYTNEQRETLLFASASYNPALFKQISFEARAVPFIQSKNKCILWINMALPVKGLILGENEGQTLKRLKLNITIDDLASERGVASRVDIPIILTPSFRRSLQKATFFGYNTCSSPLELPKDKYLMIFALYDENRRQMGTVEQMVEIPALGKKDAGLIVNVVFGNLVESLRGGQSPFTVSQKSGTLQLSKNAFYPMGLNQFRSRKNISLFLQVYSPQKQIAFESRFSFVQNGTESARVPAQLVDQSWNKKAKVWNAVFNLDFSGFSRGEHLLRIRLVDPQTQKEIEKTLAIKII